MDCCPLPNLLCSFCHIFIVLVRTHILLPCMHSYLPEISFWLFALFSPLLFLSFPSLTCTCSLPCIVHRLSASSSSAYHHHDFVIVPSTVLVPATIRTFRYPSAESQCVKLQLCVYARGIGNALSSQLVLTLSLHQSKVYRSEDRRCQKYNAFEVHPACQGSSGLKSREFV